MSPLLPRSLTRRPFTLEEARRAGLTKKRLKGSAWKRLGPEVYASAALPDTTWLRLAAAACRLPPAYAFVGLAGAFLFGLDVQPGPRPEVAVPPGCGVTTRAGLTVHRLLLGADEVEVRQRLRVASILRSLAHLARRLSLIEAVVVADQALHATLTTEAELRAYAAARAASPGVVALRRVAELADGLAESPMESRLRLLLVLAGLPKPLLQVNLRDESNAFLGRADLYYPGARLVIEFDGGVHRESLVQDNRRQNLLVQAGYKVLRFTGAALRQHPDLVVAQVALGLGLSPRGKRREASSAPAA